MIQQRVENGTSSDIFNTALPLEANKPIPQRTSWSVKSDISDSLLQLNTDLTTAISDTATALRSELTPDTAFFF
jgi:hypothetical protein